MKRKIIHIPNEIVVEEILQRLPVRSLLRFRCVSKPWCASISDPNFSLKTATERVAVGFDGLSTSENIYIVDQNSPVQDVVPVRLAKDGCGCYDQSRCSVRMLSSYGGLLLLLHGNNDIFLFNPSTRDVKLVSNFPHDRRVYHGGLCRDHVTKTYKVLMVGNQGVVRMFSLSSQIWKDIEYSHDILCYGNPVNVGEILYFLAPYKPFYVIYFDPMNDKFFELWIPESLLHKTPNIGKLDGCLALTSGNSSFEGSTEVWVMKERGVKESWTMLFRISETCLSGRLKPLVLTNDGEVILHVRGVNCKYRLVAYNFKEQSSRDVLLDPQINVTVREYYVQTPITYLPSLIPPP